MNQDAEHLRLLSIFHYVYAGLSALFSCFPLLHFGFGVAMLVQGTSRGRGEPMFIGGLFAILGIVLFIVILAIAALTAYAGKSLTERKNYTFCIVIAAINCLSFPFGTALGVFTIVVLQRAGVRAMFGKTNTPTT